MNSEIRKLITVLSSAIIAAFLLSFFFVYNYGPSGRYLVKNALLSPELTTTLSYNDINHKTGGSSRFVFDSIEFSNADSYSKQQRQLKITPEQYAQFYQLVSSDKSLQNSTEDLLALFGKGIAASLVIKVNTENHAAWQEESRVFQEVDFTKEGNYYRISLHDEKMGKWIYFYHPNIFAKVTDLFIPKDTL